jgi:hypothetical protein
MPRTCPMPHHPQMQCAVLVLFPVLAVSTTQSRALLAKMDTISCQIYTNVSLLAQPTTTSAQIIV